MKSLDAVSEKWIEVFGTSFRKNYLEVSRNDRRVGLLVLVRWGESGRLIRESPGDGIPCRRNS